MEKKNDSTILLLLAAGLGVYWLTRKKPIVTAMPVDDMPKSTLPVVELPVTDMPKYDFGGYDPNRKIPEWRSTGLYKNNNEVDETSTQPIYNEPIYVTPIMDEQIKNDEYISVTDMFNSLMKPNYDNKTPIDPVFNMNIEPIE
jgi:hypothetical protein